jgi:RNA polymerase sigma-70 factor (ECF subfamily)
MWDLVVANHLREALDTLTETEREAIELAYYGGHSYREVATILGQPEGTVKSRIRSGLKRMRDRLVAADIGEST